MKSLAFWHNQNGYQNQFPFQLCRQMSDDKVLERVWVDILKHLPTANIVCSVRLAHPRLLEIVDGDLASAMWTERRNYLLTHVEPQNYPSAIVKNGWVSVQWPDIESSTGNDNKDHHANEENDVGESQESTRKRARQAMPKVRVVEPRNREICEAFVKDAHQRWHTEYVLRSWRKQYLNTVEPLAEFWDEKWNARETAEITGVASDDPLVANAQVDIEQICQTLHNARRSTLLRVQDDESDRAREQRFFNERARKKQRENE